jgi:hypothetical protein
MEQAPGARWLECRSWQLALVRMRGLARGLGIGLALAVAGTCQMAPARGEDARGEDARADDAEDCVSGALATAAAVFPGILIHGIGHRVGGDRRTARRLLIIEGIALGGMVVSGAALGLSGASRRLSLPVILLRCSVPRDDLQGQQRLGPGHGGRHAP